MYLDGTDIGLGKVVITDSKASINNEEIPIKCINIYSRDNEYKLSFWTKQKIETFNDLELNKKIDVLDYIDDYDIVFNTKENSTINSRENSRLFFTRIDNNKYIINVIIDDLNNCVVGNLKEHKKLEIETLIDFNDKN